MIIYHYYTIALYCKADFFKEYSLLIRIEFYIKESKINTCPLSHLSITKDLLPNLRPKNFEHKNKDLACFVMATID